MNVSEIRPEKKLVIIAVICGLAAAAAVYIFLSGREAEILGKMEPVKVYAAAKVIPAWTRIEPEMLEVIELPKRYITASHTSERKKLLGRLTMVPFAQGEPLLLNKVSEGGDELNTVIPAGLRAVSVSVDEESGVGYMVSAGDYVDVILNFQGEENSKKTMTTATILQAVKVIAAGQHGSSSKSKQYASITLAVTPSEAEIIMFAKEKGRINFSLRALGDREREAIKTVSFKELHESIKSNELSTNSRREFTPAINQAAPDNNSEMKTRGE